MTEARTSQHYTFGHGLLEGHPPPSREVLTVWLDQRHIKRDERLEIASMEDGSGWRMVAKDDMDLGELICAIPKTSLLSHKTSSLPPLPDLPPEVLDSRSLNCYTILHLSLCLLHEFRLGTDSPFYGYLQALPREVIGLPLFWNMEEIGGQDGKLGRRWLKGTEVERELERRSQQSLSFGDLKAFYAATSPHLPPTPAHPAPSPFLAYLHCFALISSRAFMTDIYHLIALCPFADILNHSSSSTSHTSMMADDFVCHICGSLAPCQHDITDANGVPYRLAHLGEREIERIGREEDSVDMRVERPVVKGEEVWNCYGEGLGDAKLLVEWGFISGDFAGEGLTWNMEDLGLDRVGAMLGDDTSGKEDEDEEAKLERCWFVVESVGTTYERNLDRRKVIVNNDEEDDEDEEERLLCPPSEQDGRLLNLDQSGRLSTNIFGFLWLDQSLALPCSNSNADSNAERQAASLGKKGRSRSESDKDADDIAAQQTSRTEFGLDELEQELSSIVRSIEALEHAWSVLDGPESSNSGSGHRVDLASEHSTDATAGQERSTSSVVLDDRTKKVVERIKVILRSRLEGLHRSELSDEELFELKDNLKPTERYQDMAMTISINERVLLRSALERWEQL
ncbi:hypothetical protein I316_01903 [Kwoniella heveanensis BCC8398]|uniref:SET domain-containing protein n=1 Tax=Kwoniella heveanensis BCC8398 TaxID=1296120 RepID=A0A1B9H064_9TREE|nr:hypothetical protein I316_01903 [Kwoniella heveanensis BCC8398]